MTSGLLGLGDTVTWEAMHFGVRWRLTAQIARCEAPCFFEDRMLRGPFHALRHRHYFAAIGDSPTQTRMTDTLSYVPPLGMLGTLADRLFLAKHMREFLLERARYLKHEAERRARGHAG
jgi:ligand-binding SRPBCC domain-containing protein